MAINPETQYPGKIAPSTPAYPYGAARNITLPGDGTGTPWEAALVNDLFGFQQALLGSAGVIPSGSPDEVGASQYLEALLKTSGLVRADYAALRAVESDQFSDLTPCLITAEGVHGVFVLDKSDTVSVDNGGTVLVDADSGRWKRPPTGYINVKWFGATGDGTTEDTAAVQAAVDEGSTEVYFPDGDIFLINEVAVPSNRKLFGKATIKSLLGVSDPGGDDFSKKQFTVDNQTNIEFVGLTFDGGVVGPVGGTEFDASDPDALESMLEIQNSTRVRVLDCKFDNFNGQATSSGTRNQRAKKGVFYALACTDIEIARCVLGNNAYIEGWVVLDSSDVRLINNYSFQDDDNKRISSPVAVTGANTENVLIAKNLFIGHGGSGLNVWARRNVRIVNNSFIEARGVDFSNEGGYTVTESMEDITITGNLVDLTGSSTYTGSANRTGIHTIGDLTHQLRNILIAENTIISADRPLLVDRCDDAVVSNNIIKNPWGAGAGQGLGLMVTDCNRVQVLGNSVNGDSTVEFGGGVSCIYLEDSDDVSVKDNVMNEAATYLLYINNDNGRVYVEGNTFLYSNTTPTRNIFGSGTGASNLIIKDNSFPFLSDRVDYNCNFSSADYFVMEDEEVIEIADDTAFIFPFTSTQYFLEISTQGNGNAAGMAYADPVIQSIYAASALNFTTGVLTGTDGTDGQLNVSSVGGTLYVENRLGSTQNIRVKIRG